MPPPTLLPRTLRDYFAAHAPLDPEMWFQIEMPTERPRPTFKADEGGKTYKTASEAAKECGDCFHVANLAEINEWDRERERLRSANWPWAWADNVLSARGNHLKPEQE